MNTGITIFGHTQACDLELTLPSLNNPFLKARVETAIKNAWLAGAILDGAGRVWVNSKYLHVIIRTSVANAAYIIGGLMNHEKYLNGHDTYINGSTVFYLIDRNLQSARGIARENYIRLSELIYRAIRDSDVARLKRAEFYEHISRVISQLKNKRICDYRITSDELTGVPLNKATAEFSHICSVSLYPQLAAILENGLIVNKDTHDIITANSINDGEELLALCEAYGWNTDWYVHHNEMLRLL